MNNNLIGILLSVVENAVIIQIMNNFLKPRYKSSWVPFIFIFTCIAMIINTFENPLCLIPVLLLLNVFTIACYENSLIYKCVVASIIFIVNAFLSYAIITSLSAYNQIISVLLHENVLFYISVVLISKFLLIIVAMMLKTILVNRNDMTIQWKLVLLEMIVFMFTISYCFYKYIQDSLDATVASMLLSYILILLLITLYITAKYYNNLRQMEKEKNIKKTQDAYMHFSENENVILEIYESALHDVRDRSIAIQQHIDSLLHSYPNDEDVKKINEILAGRNDIDVPLFMDTSNVKLNNIINHKAYIMSKYGIRFECFTEHALDFIDDEDLIIIFGMILDRMTDISKSFSKPYIKLVISTIELGVKIYFECGVSKIKEFDLTELKEIVNKYQGHCQEFIIDERLKVKIILPEREGD